MDHFVAYQLEFLCEATTGISLPRYNGSTLRGAFFSALRRDFCLNRERDSCLKCPAAEVCPICRLVATVDRGSERGAEIPRPFVLRPLLGEKTRFKLGETFSFGITLFGDSLSLFPYLILAVKRMGEIGMGDRKKVPGQFILREAKSLNPFTACEQSLYTDESRTVNVPEVNITHPDILAFSAGLSGEKTCLSILTPLRLVIQGALVRKLTFQVFLQRLLRRLTDLYRFCCDQDLALDFVGLRKKAEEVQIAQDSTRWADIESYSARRRTTTPTGGLVGDIVFEGPLNTFLPFLAWGTLTHVGKNATRGNGWYLIQDNSLSINLESFWANDQRG